MDEVDPRKFSAPRPFTRRALYVFLHECAHIVLHHVNRTEHRKLKSWEREQQAEDWARDRMRAHGIAVPHESRRSGREYVARKREFGRRISQARKAGG